MNATSEMISRSWSGAAVDACATATGRHAASCARRRPARSIAARTRAGMCRADRESRRRRRPAPRRSTRRPRARSVFIGPWRRTILAAVPKRRKLRVRGDAVAPRVERPSTGKVSLHLDRHQHAELRRSARIRRACALRRPAADRGFERSAPRRAADRPVAGSIQARITLLTCRCLRTASRSASASTVSMKHDLRGVDAANPSPCRVELERCRRLRLRGCRNSSGSCRHIGGSRQAEIVLGARVQQRPGLRHRVAASEQQRR